MTLKAIIFDVDGTLAETEDWHRQAFNRAFAEAGRNWHWDRDLYRELLRVNGGRERFRHYLDSIGAALPDADLAAIHRRKNAIYAEHVAAGDISLRPGVARLIAEAEALELKLAIATTTGRDNLRALLDGLLPAVAFDALATGEDVGAKKPDPEVYRCALAALGLAPAQCVAVEDSRIGLDAALAAGIATVVTPSTYCDHERFDGAALVRADLDGPPPVTVPVLERLVTPLARAS